MKAVLCPVCQGTGKYLEKTCHGCNGKGWIIIPGSNFPYYPEPYPYTYWPKPWTTEQEDWT